MKKIFAALVVLAVIAFGGYKVWQDKETQKQYEIDKGNASNAIASNSPVLARVLEDRRKFFETEFAPKGFKKENLRMVTIRQKELDIDKVEALQQYLSLQDAVSMQVETYAREEFPKLTGKDRDLAQDQIRHFEQLDRNVHAVLQTQASLKNSQRRLEEQRGKYEPTSDDFFWQRLAHSNQPHNYL